MLHTLTFSNFPLYFSSTSHVHYMAFIPACKCFLKLNPPRTQPGQRPTTLGGLRENVNAQEGESVIECKPPVLRPLWGSASAMAGTGVLVSSWRRWMGVVWEIPNELIAGCRSQTGRLLNTKSGERGLTAATARWLSSSGHGALPRIRGWEKKWAFGLHLDYVLGGGDAMTHGGVRGISSINDAVFAHCEMEANRRRPGGHADLPFVKQWKCCRAVRTFLSVL